MLHYNRIYISEGPTKSRELILLKVIEVKNAWFVTIAFLIMNSNFKTVYAMVAMIWQFYVLLQVILLLSLLKFLIIILLFITLTSLKQLIY